ncbi:Hypothetical_protein [Hexamita inflata]|uniref:Hypothetical_protein n=1 Tax=Hexamita inflata TaxID=28002 RepID=A0AA86PQZ3_9EUKA|nr:Hypothetical protein HINF_LOCUS30898 [Hexamita inflata]
MKIPMQQTNILPSITENANEPVVANSTCKNSIQKEFSKINSNTCDLFWDESSRTNVLLKKIKIVNGHKNIKSIQIETNNDVNESKDEDMFDIFGDDVFSL